MNEKDILGFWRSNYTDSSGNIYLGGGVSNSVPQAIIVPDQLESQLLEGDWTDLQYRGTKTFTTTLAPRAVVSSAFTPSTTIPVQQSLSITGSDAQVNLRVWVSSTPNGAALAGTDFTYTPNAVFTFTSAFSRPPYPEVTTGSVLYLNIANLSNSRQTTISRYSVGKLTGFVCPRTVEDNWDNNGTPNESFVYSWSGAASGLTLKSVDNGTQTTFPGHLIYGFGWSECTPTINLPFNSDTPISIVKCYGQETTGTTWNNGIEGTSVIEFSTPVSTLFPTFIRGGITRKITSISTLIGFNLRTAFISNDWILEGNRLIIPKSFLLATFKEAYEKIEQGNSATVSFGFLTEVV